MKKSTAQRNIDELEDPLFASMKEDAILYVSEHSGKTKYIPEYDDEEEYENEYEYLSSHPADITSDLSYHPLPGKYKFSSEYTPEEVEILKKVLGSKDLYKLLSKNSNHGQRYTDDDYHYEEEGKKITDEWEDPVFTKMKQDAYEYIEYHFSKTRLCDSFSDLEPSYSHTTFTAQETEGANALFGEDIATDDLE